MVMDMKHTGSVLGTLAMSLAGCSAAGDAEPPAIVSEKPLSGNATGTTLAALNVRTEPNTTSPILTTLAAGKKVDIGCQITGQLVNESAVWDFSTSHQGYVSDAFVHTGHAGFIPGVPRCGCDGLDYAGECQGDVLSWCENGKKRTEDCAAKGRTCGFQDASVGYNCLHEGVSGSLVVHGTPLDASQDQWVRYIAEHVVPAMSQGRAERIHRSARVAWWSLKEGVLNLDNPLAYSNCHFPPDQLVGPLEVCPDPGNAWQVGLSGVQAAWRTLSEVESLAKSVHPKQSLQEILLGAAKAAGYSATSTTAKSIQSATGRLRLSWLLRDAAVGFEAQYPVVENECFVTCSNGWENTCAWCFGSGWDTSAAFAPDRASAEQAVADLEGILNELAP
jgi:hypothetical protein